MREDQVFRDQVSRIEPVGLLMVLWKELTALRNKPNDALWVSANGFVYDVTHLPLWANGRHRNLHQVGEELTYQLMKRSPHGAKILEKAVVIGILGFEWDDLAGMNGKQYTFQMVSIEAIVYDVTQLNRWRGGNHMGQHKSGEELTYQLLRRAPHSLTLLSRGFSVGILVCKNDEIKIVLKKDTAYELVQETIYDKRIQKSICRIIE
jgi:predicted heme/steroid binding protein